MQGFAATIKWHFSTAFSSCIIHDQCCVIGSGRSWVTRHRPGLFRILQPVLSYAGQYQTNIGNQVRWWCSNKTSKLLLTFQNKRENLRFTMDKSDRKCIKQPMKKKSVDHIIFSTMSLMNTITNDMDISSPLNCAIREEDLGKIRQV